MKRIPVVIGIIFNDTRDRVLLSVRAAGLTQSGLWEFPGGKLEAGETILQGLRRELFEETNIIVESAHHLLKIDHDYAELGIRLHAWVVDSWSGVPRGKEGQKVEWMPVKNLAEIPFPAANKRLIQVVTLPQLYLITPDREIYNDDFLNQVKQLIDNGLELLQFRSWKSSYEEHRSVVRELVQLCSNTRCRLLYNGDIEKGLTLGVHGFHLQTSSLMKLSARPVSDDLFLAASCHSREELDHAAQIGADFCVLSPVKHTSTHPGINGMGWDRVNELAGVSAIPVYALGGLTPQELEQACHSHACGIAMIRGIWDAANPVEAMKYMSAHRPGQY